ncbi:MAG: pantetheine-phosphate adenylyltransferase [Paludibacteraceae bacterium]|nr:pantetheine-phosphate adenylyltransferase [Paludibacteraceae bacterium]
MEQKIAVFVGSFDPFTIGHYDIVQRGLALFDKIIIGIGVNIDKTKCDSMAQERLTYIQSIFKDNQRVEVALYEGLSVDFAKQNAAKFILRGVRNIVDFEYESNMAVINRTLSGIETVLLPAKPELAHVSSSIVRELKKYNQNIENFLVK